MGRNLAWTARFRRPARAYERPEATREGFHDVASAFPAPEKVTPGLAIL